MKIHALALLALLSLYGPARAADIVAHRGASFDAPENTLASSRLAWAQGADVVETDIHLTGDGKVVVSHDPNTKRTTGRDLVIADTPLETLRVLDAGTWKDPRFSGEKLPLLEELIALVPPGKRMFIEIKTGPEILPALEECLARAGAGAGMITFLSFNLETLKALRSRLPSYRTEFLAGYKAPGAKGKGGKPQPTLDEVIGKARGAGLSGLDLQYTWPLTAEDVRRIREAGLELHVWTVDDPVEARRWIGLGAMSITTNRPAWMREQLSH